MADLIVSPIVSLTIEKLGELLVQEVFFLSDVRDEVKGLQSKLEWMRCFLKDAEARQQKDERICNRVREIRDVAYEVEDVIDTYVHGRRRRRSFTQNCFGMVNKGKDLYKLRKQIKKIQKKIGEISHNRETYGIKDIDR
uniref:Disease resistance N-terminal domain-containing protein n=1 Tax=Nelumbo nucifera TaxID=4432 RepID=A0A822ZS81_NELNU|nr:TPA_asm: hypothetical protein HUJ06_017684 [Nelumbo nucifera]